MSKSASIPFKSLDFDAAAAAAERISQTHNIPALTFPRQQDRGGEARGPVAAPIASTPEPTTPQRQTERMPVTLPAYVATDIRQRALNAKTSYRFIIMQALKKGGIPIADEDLIEDGRRVR